MSREYRKIDVTGDSLTPEEMYTVKYIRAGISRWMTLSYRLVGSLSPRRSDGKDR